MPFKGPIAGLRVGLTDSKLDVYCKNLEIEWAENDTDLDLLFSANKDGIVMFDTAANIIPEETIIKGIKLGFEEAKKIIAAQEDLVKQVSPKKIEYEPSESDEEMMKKIRDDFGREIEESVLRGGMEGYFVSSDEILDKIFEAYEGEYTKSAMSSAVGLLRKEVVKNLVISSKKRVDGRGLEDIRPIDTKTKLLPRVRGI